MYQTNLARELSGDLHKARCTLFVIEAETRNSQQSVQLHDLDASLCVEAWGGDARQLCVRGDSIVCDVQAR